MTDRPREPINAITERDRNRIAIASRFASKVFVTYPSFDVWRSVYDPNDLFHRFNDQKLGPDGYQRMRQSHLASTTKVLNRIHDFSTGKAVLRQVQTTRPKFIVEIYPRPFMSAEDLLHTASEVTDKQLTPSEALCVAFDLQDAACARARVGGVNVFFDAHRTAGPKMPDDILAHELVHAGRHGLSIRHPDRSVAGVRYEEFIANLIQNIYRSERGAAPFDYSINPINPKTFFTVEIRNVISELLQEQPVFKSIADIQCHFNPIRDVAKPR